MFSCHEDKEDSQKILTCNEDETNIVRLNDLIKNNLKGRVKSILIKRYEANNLRMEIIKGRRTDVRSDKGFGSYGYVDGFHKSQKSIKYNETGNKHEEILNLNSYIYNNQLYTHTIKTNYIYSKDGLLLIEIDSAANNIPFLLDSNMKYSSKIEYDYNNDQDTIRKVNYESAGEWGNYEDTSFVVEMKYDKLNRNIKQYNLMPIDMYFLPAVYDSSIYKYDEYDNVVTKIYYVQGRISGFFNCEYDTLGKLVKKREIKEDGQYDKVWTFAYDEKNNLQAILFLNNVSDYYWETNLLRNEYIYDENNNWVSKTSWHYNVNIGEVQYNTQLNFIDITEREIEYFK